MNCMTLASPLGGSNSTVGSAAPPSVAGSVDVAAVDEATNQSNGAVSEGLSGRVPTRLLHLQHIQHSGLETRSEFEPVQELMIRMARVPS